MKRITIMVLVGLITLVMKAQSVDAGESKSIKDLETTYDTTIGVYGINTQDGKQIEHHADERFAFASTYKAIASGILLNQLSPQDLNQKVTIKNQILLHTHRLQKNILVRR